MRLGVLPTPSMIHSHIIFCVYGKRAVRIDGNQKQAGIRLLEISTNYFYLEQLAYIDQIGLVSCVYIMNNGCFIKVCQLSHIVCLIEFCWIDFLHAFRVNLPLLKRNQ